MRRRGRGTVEPRNTRKARKRREKNAGSPRRLWRLAKTGRRNDFNREIREKRENNREEPLDCRAAFGGSQRRGGGTILTAKYAKSAKKKIEERRIAAPPLAAREDVPRVAH